MKLFCERKSARLRHPPGVGQGRQSRIVIGASPSIKPVLNALRALGRGCPEGDRKPVGIALFSNIDRPAACFVRLNSWLFGPDQAIGLDREPESNIRAANLLLDGSAAMDGA